MYEIEINSGVFVAAKRQSMGKDEEGRTIWREAGEPVPEAAGWRRLFVSLERGDIVRMSPDACAAIVRAALRADPSLAQELGGARVAETDPEHDPETDPETDGPSSAPGTWHPKRRRGGQ